MSFTTHRDASVPEPGLHMGVDHVAPHDTTATGVPAAPAAVPVTPAARTRPVPWHHPLLAAAALAAPVLMGLQYLLDTAGLPRDDAATYLGHVADSPGRYLASTCVYIASMACLLAGARIVALGCGARAPRLAPVAAVALSLGALGGMGFAGLRLVALAMVEDGHVRAGTADTWVRIQEGAAFGVLQWLLVMAILGTLLATAAMVVARKDVTWWAAPVNVAGFVLASGEFPPVVSVLGGVVTLVATVPVARAALRAR